MLARVEVSISEDAWLWYHALGAEPWAPDGRELLFPRRDGTGAVGIWKVEVSTGASTQLSRPPPGVMDLGASFSPDGRTIAFDRGQWQAANLWTMAPDGSGARPLPDSLEWAFGAAWTPDGRALVFSGDFNLWRRPMPDGEPEALTSGYNWIFGIDVGPRGEIAYSVTPHLTNLYSGVSGQPPDQHALVTRDTRDEYNARAAPNGRRVVYSSDRQGPADIWVWDTDAGEHVQMTRGPDVDHLPDWLPDGGIVFVSNRGGEVDRFWTVAGEGAQPRVLVSGLAPINCFVPYCRKGPNTSPDGRAIGFIGTSRTGETLWLTDVDGGNPRRAGIGGAQSFDWYLDGRRVVYTTPSNETGQVELRAAHLDTGREVVLYRGSATEPSVTQDGRAIAFLHGASHYNMNAFVLDVAPPAAASDLPTPLGEPRPLIDGRGVWHVHNFDWLPGTRSFVYTRDQDDGDVFVLRPASIGAR